MPKPISTQIHGVIDYIAALTLIILPRLLGWSAPTTILLTILGIGLVLYSMVTNYELSVLKLLPMKGHLVLDALSGLTVIIAAFLVPATGMGEIIGLIILGLFELGAVALTKTHSTTEEKMARQRQPQSVYDRPSAYDRPPKY